MNLNLRLFKPLLLKFQKERAEILHTSWVNTQAAVEKLIQLEASWCTGTWLVNIWKSSHKKIYPSRATEWYPLQLNRSPRRRWLESYMLDEVSHCRFVLFQPSTDVYSAHCLRQNTTRWGLGDLTQYSLSHAVLLQMDSMPAYDVSKARDDQDWNCNWSQIIACSSVPRTIST